MLRQIAINLIFALTWMFLNTPSTLNNFLAGWLMGLVIVYFWQRQHSGYFYLRNLWDIFFLVLVFFREVIKSCLLVMKLALNPWKEPRCGIIEYETQLTVPWHVVLLANMITITPGSVVLEISEDNRIFYIHVFDFDDADNFRMDVRKYFEDNIRKVAE